MTSRRPFLLLSLLLSLFVTASPAQQPPSNALGPLDSPLWLRYPQISPDGTQVAFAFEGNLFVVPAKGGAARLLVGNGHHNFRPVWSPDSRLIAYASDSFGNFDVFVVAADGGPSRRLTTHSANELPLAFTPDGREVLFSAQRMDSRTNALFPSRGMGELYKVSIESGRRPVQVLTTPVSAARYDTAGQRLLYEDLKGYENVWRKHHVSPVAHDVWLYDAATSRHTRLTDFGGEDRDPVWAPDGRSFYYLSERSGTFNVWRQSIDAGGAPVQVTRFEKNPVRFLSVATDGTLCFGVDGELYTLADGSAPAKLPVRIAADLRADPVENLRLTKGATEIAVSPDGQEIAFVVRGHVFVASTEFGDTRRITDGAAQARSVSFSPDGRRLVFASEVGASWGLYEASVADDRKDAPYFFSAAQVQIRTVLKNEHENFQPRYSPDGRGIAYLEDRVTLKALDLATGASRVLLPGSFNYSYADGDQWFDWSPDGQSLLTTFVDRNRWSSEVGLVDAQGRVPLLNLTQSGYEDLHPVWTRGGQQMMWISDRMGLHGTSGSSQQDLFAMFLTREAFDRFNLDKSEFALLKKQEDEERKARDEKAAEARKAKAGDGRSTEQKEADKKDRRVANAREKAGLKDEPIQLPPPVRIDRENLEERVARLTPNSAVVRGAAMTPDGETLFFLTQSASGVELWIDRMRNKELRKVGEFPAPQKSFAGATPPVDLVLDAKGENGFVLADGAIQKFKVLKEGLEVKTEPLAFSAELRVDRREERARMFEHVWRQTRQKLYVQDMNGVDWAGYRAVYEKFLPFIVDNRDFAELLSEMLGELNVSHTGAGYLPRAEGSDATAALGLFFDDAWAGAGLKVAEVIEGGPLATARSRVRAGMVIEKIDGTAILPGREFDSLLNRRAGQRIELAVFDPATGQRFAQTTRPIALEAQNELLYKRWVRTERETVDRLSGGQLGYVHVRAMDDDSYRDTYAEILGRQSGKRALIVDTRFNGGGNLHDELATLLSGRRYLEFLPRGQSLGWEPSGKWTKPSLVVMSESNYSDAHLFPWTYRHLGIGKLLGMPVAGTGTAVWWELLQDDTVYFGIPQVGYRDERGEFMERALIEPDIRVPNDADQLAAGRDQQIEAAVKALMGP